MCFVCFVLACFVLQRSICDVLWNTCNSSEDILCLQAGNGLWYRMNDASVELSDIKTVLNQQAYVLFYIR